MLNIKYPLNTKIGVIGGGQLGKMMLLEAKKMGFYAVVLDPSKNCPCHSICDYHIIAAFDDEAAMRSLANMCDVITYEFEHIGADYLEKIEIGGKPVYPTCKSLKVIQNKITQKTALSNYGLPVPNFCEVFSCEDIEKKADSFPKILKSAGGGYDGKGNYVISVKSDIAAAFDALKTNGRLMLEDYVPFAHEVSVLTCRAINGETAIYPVGKNIHKNNILEKTIVPAPISAETQKNAVSIAKEVMNVFDGVGMFCVEMFVKNDGSLLINEVAPRPHNSGHYTIEACAVSQFEQHIRAITGLPLGSTRLLSPVVMANILGEDGEDGTAVCTGCEEALKIEGLTLHIYGKEFTKPKRKMGHLTVCGDNVSECELLADKGAQLIKVVADN